MYAEKAKRKNDYKAKLTPYLKLHDDILKVLIYLGCALFLVGVLLSGGQLVFATIALIVSLSEWSILVLIGILISLLVIYSVLYTASSLSAHIFTGLPFQQYSTNLAVGVVLSIIICMLMGAFQITIPVSMLYTAVSRVRRRKHARKFAKQKLYATIESA